MQVSSITGIIKDDFLVNDDTTGGCLQDHPAVAMDPGGNFVLCWIDFRNGRDNGDIYAQRYSSSGDTLGSNFLVNDDQGISWQYSPSVVIDADGGFLICWTDERNGDSDIYAQRFSSSGDSLGGNFRVNDDEGTSEQYSPSVAMDKYGGFLICWEDGRNGYWNGDIYAQRYSSSGDTLGSNFWVNDDQGISYQGAPSVAMDKYGGFLICWQDERNDDWDIYAQRYSSSGDTLGSNFQVNDDQGTSDQGYPSVAMNGDSGVLICWQDGRNGWDNRDIYAQRYNNSGDTLGGNFRVNDDQGTSEQGDPSVAMDGNGGFLICWQDERNDDWDIYAQRYSSSGDTLGSNFLVNDDQGTSDQRYPSVEINGDSGVLICWRDERNGNDDIYCQRYDSSDYPLGGNFRVNDDQGTSDQRYPSVALDGDSGFHICWQDERNDDWDIYAQRYNISGYTLGSNFQVNDDQGTSSQWHPSVAMNREGDFVICWQDERNGWDWDIYAQRYDSSGDTLRSNFQVNDDQGTSEQGDPLVAMDGDGGFLICWRDERSGEPDIYAQRYDSSGDTLGGNFRVNDDQGTSNQWWSPSVAMDEDGDFVICWTDERNGDSDIYAQRFSSSGDPPGGNFRVNDDEGASWQGDPSVAMNRDGDFVICWQDGRNDYEDIYCQRYDSSGDTLGSNFQVNDDQGISYQYVPPSVAMDGAGGFVICWQDERNGWDNDDIYAQRYHPDGTPWGTNYIVNQRPDVLNPNQGNPSVAANSGQISFAWMDLRRSKGWDIYAKLVTWDWEKVEELGGDVGLTKDFALLQNYPNPFNSTTAISYQLSGVSYQQSAVSLKIYNILGQEVKTLVDEELAGGNYRVLWDGRNDSGKEVSSGVYFCRLKVKGERLKVQRTKKMMLIR